MRRKEWEGKVTELEDGTVQYELPEPSPLPTLEERANKRRRTARRRFWEYGILLSILYFAFWYQPYEFDWVSRKVPVPNPFIDPDSKGLFAKGAKILIVTAHPDDSEFFIGGLLTRLKASDADLNQVICTDGDKGYYWIFTDAAHNRVIRRKEAVAAATTWHGKSVTFLGYPDRWLHPNRNVIENISQAIRETKPDYVLAFDGAFPPRFSHQDHRRSGDAAIAAAKETGIPKWVLLFSTIAPNYIVDISDQWEDQKKLLAIHRSQFFGKRLEGVENMVEYTAEKDGEKGGFMLGEGFRCIKIR